MNSNRFDQITRRIAGGMSRRSLLRGATAAGAVSIAGMTATIAQEATPVAVQDNWLMVVNFEGAELAIPADGPDMTITLTGVDGHVMAFTDRPVRDYHLTPLATAAAAINAAASDPLNATLVARPPLSRDSLDLVVVLLAATVDSENERLVLEARMLGGPLLTTTRDRAPGQPTTLRGGSLFIDDADLTNAGPSDYCAGLQEQCGDILIDETDGTTTHVDCCSGQNLACTFYQSYSDPDTGLAENYFMCLPSGTTCASEGESCDLAPCCDGYICVGNAGAGGGDSVNFACSSPGAS